MKKFAIIIILMGLLGTGCSKMTISQDDNDVKLAKQQIANYFAYKADLEENHRVTKSKDNDLYYYAADNKRYVFQNEDAYKSWFSDYPVKDLQMQTLETFYKTQLGGIVTLRPGSLLQTESDSNIYLVAKEGTIRPFGDQKLIAQLYGSDWQKLVYNLPVWFFSAYIITDPIKTAKDFPTIPLAITIDQAKGLYKL
jgi:hypothetical protein